MTPAPFHRRKADIFPFHFINIEDGTGFAVEVALDVSLIERKMRETHR